MAVPESADALKTPGAEWRLRKLGSDHWATERKASAMKLRGFQPDDLACLSRKTHAVWIEMYMFKRHLYSAKGICAFLEAFWGSGSAFEVIPIWRNFARTPFS